VKISLGPHPDHYVESPLDLSGQKDFVGGTFVKTYNMDDPRQRREFEQIDSKAREWASAVYSMWERFGSERDQAESVDSAVERGRAEGLDRVIEILNEELERRGLDLEASLD
jgi:hypothetical protein